MSMICASGAIRLITPWQVPTKSSWRPKSLRKVTNTRRSLSPRAGPRRRASPPRATTSTPGLPRGRVVCGPMLTAGMPAPGGRTHAPPTPMRARRGLPRELAAASAPASGRAGRSRRRARRRAASARPRRRRRARARPGAAAPRAAPPASRPPGTRSAPPSASAVARADRSHPRGRPGHPPPQLARAVDARDDHPVVAGDVDRLVPERLDLEQRAVDDLVPERLQPADQLLLLALRPRDDDPHATNASSSRATASGSTARTPLDPGAVLVRDERRQRARRRGTRPPARDSRRRSARRSAAPPPLGAASRDRRRPRRAPPRPPAPAARAPPAPPREAARPARSAGRSRRRGRAGRARTPPARPRRDRARRACAAGCRCCRAAARSRASARARAAARGGGPRPSRSASRPQLARAAERVARILARRVRADDEPLRVRRGHVLRRVDGDVDPPLEQRLLELLDEDAARADLAEGLRPVAVARRRDRHERDLDPGAARAAARPPAPPG